MRQEKYNEFNDINIMKKFLISQECCISYEISTDLFPRNFTAIYEAPIIIDEGYIILPSIDLIVSMHHRDVSRPGVDNAR